MIALARARALICEKATSKEESSEQDKRANVYGFVEDDKEA
jgi:hypothetical protein